jgi:hypothetical protein
MGMNAREVDYPFERANDLPRGESKNGSEKEDVLASRQLLVEARTDLEQRQYPPRYARLARGRNRYA